VSCKPRAQLVPDWRAGCPARGLAASRPPLKASSARGAQVVPGAAERPRRSGRALAFSSLLTPGSMAKILHAPLRALTAPELPSEGGGPLVFRRVARLRDGRHRLNGAHLPLLSLAEPVRIALAFLHHPIDVAAEFP